MANSERGQQPWSRLLGGVLLLLLVVIASVATVANRDPNGAPPMATDVAPSPIAVGAPAIADAFTAGDSRTIMSAVAPPAATAGDVIRAGTGDGSTTSVVAPPAAPAPDRRRPVEPVPAAPSIAASELARSPLPAPRSQFTAAQAVSQGVSARRSVALTFDAGADRGYGELILDILLYLGVKASFGMTGVWAEANPQLVQRMALEGHRLINHSYDHSSFTGLSSNRRPLSPEQRRWQLERTEAIIVELTGQSTVPLFRSPYGDTDAGVLRDLGAAGYAYNVLWTVDSGGWMNYSTGAIIERCLRQARPGAIYVMHVGAASRDALALPAIIADLRDAGYTFESVDEILE